MGGGVLMDLKELRSRGYAVHHTLSGGLQVSGPKPTEELKREIAEHKRELLLESFGEFMRELDPPFDASDLSDLELGLLVASMLGETLEGLGLARRES